MQAISCKSGSYRAVYIYSFQRGDFGFDSCVYVKCRITPPSGHLL